MKPRSDGPDIPDDVGAFNLAPETFFGQGRDQMGFGLGSRLPRQPSAAGQYAIRLSRSEQAGGAKPRSAASERSGATRVGNGWPIYPPRTIAPSA